MAEEGHMFPRSKPKEKKMVANGTEIKDKDVQANGRSSRNEQRRRLIQCRERQSLYKCTMQSLERKS